MTPMPGPIGEPLYRRYLDALLRGERRRCRAVVERLLADDVAIKEIYTQLFQRSLYEVGDLWERAAVSVAVEHLATAITEGLLDLVYPRLFAGERRGRSAVIACVANEHHQIGAKMVADVFELDGWDAHFLGADADRGALLAATEARRPEVVGLSLALAANVHELRRLAGEIRGSFPGLQLVVGGQALRWLDAGALARETGARYLATLDEVERFLREG